MDPVRLDHLNLTVRDFDETVDWYGRVFGFSLVEEGTWEGVRWGVLRSGVGKGDALLCIYHHPEHAFPGNEELGRRRVHGIRHAGFRITDEEKWRKVVARQGLDVEEIAYPRSHSWYVNDPTGYEIEVVLWRGDRVVFGALQKEEA